jgi:hypothetical protein
MIGQICPYCGSRDLDPACGWRHRAALLGAATGSAMVVMRIIARSSPVLASALLVGGALGLLWGAQAGWSIGEKADSLYPQRYRCRSCGKEFGY